LVSGTEGKGGRRQNLRGTGERALLGKAWCVGEEMKRAVGMKAGRLSLLAGKKIVKKMSDSGALS